MLLKIGQARVMILEDGYVKTMMPTGVVEAFPERTSYQVANAWSLGYGDDIVKSTVEHELAHSMMADWLGIGCSPTLQAVSRKERWDHWQREEYAVLGIQGFIRAANVDLLSLAKERYK
jgi:hypothetical protein